MPCRQRGHASGPFARPAVAVVGAAVAGVTAVVGLAVVARRALAAVLAVGMVVACPAVVDGGGVVVAEARFERRSVVAIVVAFAGDLEATRSRRRLRVPGTVVANGDA